MVVFFAILYALGSMILGGMLIITPLRPPYFWEFLWGSALGQGSWNYPGFLYVAPWGVVSLPFLATWSMVAVATGVGIGVSVALLISVRLVRDRKRTATQPGAIGSVAGLTPAMIALVTLGACCSTTAAATAGVGLVAQASGSSLDNLLINNWYLDVFQVAVVFIALLAQEMILEVYGGLFGLAALGPERSAPEPPVAPSTARTLWGGAARATLLLGGVTWSLAMVAEWTTVSPFAATPTLWFQWIFQHQFIAVLAILVALFPRELAAFFVRRPARLTELVVRGGMLAGGMSLIAWMPPALALGGAPGFVNELFGVWGLPASWGAVAPVYSPGLALFVRWGLQYLLLGGFAVAVALVPRSTFAPNSTRVTSRTRVPGSAPFGTRPVVPPTSSLGIHPFEGRGTISDPSAAARVIRDP